MGGFYVGEIARRALAQLFEAGELWAGADCVESRAGRRDGARPSEEKARIWGGGAVESGSAPFPLEEKGGR